MSCFEMITLPLEIIALALEIDGYVTLPLEFVNRRSVACSWIVACALV